MAGTEYPTAARSAIGPAEVCAVHDAGVDGELLGSVLSD